MYKHQYDTFALGIKRQKQRNPLNKT